ncbi:cell death activator cide-3-like, partial [Plakobranchus ocellatus]
MLFQSSLPDETWAQCDKCLKWRHLPDRVNPETLPDEWTCADNPDVTHNRCFNPEELEDIYDPDDISLKRMSARKAVAKSVYQRPLHKAKEKSSLDVDIGFERFGLKRRSEQVGRVELQEPMKKRHTGSKESAADVDIGFARVLLKRLEEPGKKSHVLSKESGPQLGQSGITGKISEDKREDFESKLALPKYTAEQKAKAKKSVEKLMPPTFKRATAKPDFEEFLYEPIKPKPTRPFKVWNFDRTVKKSVMAISFEDFIKKGCSKLGLTERPRIVLEEDGTEVDDDDYFSFLPDDSIFLLLRKGETWQPAKK